MRTVLLGLFTASARSRKRARTATLLLGVGALVLLVAASAQARVVRGGAPAGHQPDRTSNARPSAPDTLPARPAEAAPVSADAAAARRDFRADAGRFGLLTVNAATGTPRAVGRLDGFLTAPSARDARDIALDYVRAHPDIFGIDEADLDGMQVVRRYSAGGIEHVRWAQVYEGIKAIDTSLTANLTLNGRLINVLGSPRHDLLVPSVVPAIGAEAAYEAAARALDGRGSAVSERKGGAARATEFADGGTAKLVIYEAASGPRLGWRLLVKVDSQHVYDAVVDATSGQLVRRQNLVEFATASRYTNYPGAPAGGTASVVNIDAYLNLGATQLIGPNAHTFADINDIVQGPGSPPPPAGGAIPASGGNWNYVLTNIGACSPLPCTWDAFTANSWTTNRNADATQIHWFVNNFHDHLENTPAIAFTNAAGNFEGADPVLAQAIDGADTPTGTGFPDGDHINNANMLTLPEGQSPYMQMYLTDIDEPHWASTGFDATVVYHEYGHGLVGRTITDADGNQAVGGAQGGAMNEATADWYAVDYLVEQALETDGASPDLILAKFTFGALRTQPIDCEVGSPAGSCPGNGTAGSGGYTYGDFGKISGLGPRVHSDGEIWSETMWQLRRALVAAHGAVSGTDRVRKLYTTGMRLTPDNPSYLDLRNAILQADTTHALGNSATIWSVFASRGMGYFASTTDAGDTAPVENFSTPPAPGSTGTVTGTVTDAGTGTNAVGVKVGFTGHDSGVGPELSALTNASGVYTISNVPTGTYPILRARAGGMEEGRKNNVVVTTGTNTHNFALRRNLASPEGGASIDSFTGPDYTAFGCGPGDLIDGSQGVVWGSNSPNNPPGSGPKQVVVELSATATVGTIEIDPGAGCGDDDSASLGQYEVHVSPNGTAYTMVASGTFNAGDNHVFNEVTLTSKPAGTRFVKLIAKTSQSSLGDGASFMDVAEMKVFAEPSAPTPPNTLMPSGPVSGSWVRPSASFTLASDPAGASFECRVNAGAWSACSSPHTVATVVPGQFVLEFRAVGAGGPDASPVVRELRVVRPFAADWDGNGKANVGVWRPSNGGWYVQGSALSVFGANGDVPVPGQWDADAALDRAVWRPGNGGWYVQGSAAVLFGVSSDVPVAADWDADGDLDAAVWRPSTGVWYLRGLGSFAFGASGDVPVPGDYDADPQLDRAVFRPANGGWYVQGSPVVFHGVAGDIPVPGDWNGNGKTDIAVYRPSNSTWYLRGISTTAFGVNGDVPVVGDFDADPALDRAVWRPSNGGWYVQGSPTILFGLSTDIP